MEQKTTINIEIQFDLDENIVSKEQLLKEIGQYIKRRLENGKHGNAYKKTESSD